MTDEQQAVMYRILEKKMCPITGDPLKNVCFGIAIKKIKGVPHFCLYRSVGGVLDKQPLVVSTSIEGVHVYYGPLQG